MFEMGVSMQSIVMCGIPRSGSTMVWQILQDLYPDQTILQTHPAIWTPDGSIAVVTIRDPRDIVASLYRVRLSRNGKTTGDVEDLKAVIVQAYRHFNALPAIICKPCILIKYEDFYNQRDVLYAILQRRLKIEIPLIKRQELDLKFSLAANRKRADDLVDFNVVGEYQIHGDHIGATMPGYWRAHWGYEYIAEECAELCRRWDYAN